MSCQNFCFSEDADVLASHGAVQWAVDLFRARGHKNEYAIELAAEAYRITPRRVWSLKYLTQPVRVRRAQRQELLRRKWQLMDEEAARLERRAEELRLQREAEQAAELAALQLPLPLEAPCSDSRSHGSASGDGA